MPGAAIVITVDDEDFKRAFRRLRRRAKNLRPAMDEIGARLEASTLHRFETETAPSGEPWKPSRRARREHGQTLTDTGRLRASVTRRARRMEAVVGTNVAYAAIHQLGGRTRPHTIRPRRRRALAWPGAAHPVAKVEHPGSDIPARPFLGISTGDRKAILGILERHAMEAWS